MQAGFRPNYSPQRDSHLSKPLSVLQVSKPALIAIPVRAHVRQFLLKEFGPDPHQVHQKTYIGQQVLMVAEQRAFRQERPASSPALKESYRILLPKALKHRVIPQDSLRQMGAALEKYFQDMLVCFVKGHVHAGQNERAALRAFWDLYDINPDDYDIENGRKQYRDYKDTVLRHNGQLTEVYHAPLAVAS